MTEEREATQQTNKNSDENKKCKKVEIIQEIQVYMFALKNKKNNRRKKCSIFFNFFFILEMNRESPSGFLHARTVWRKLLHFFSVPLPLSTFTHTQKKNTNIIRIGNDSANSVAPYYAAASVLKEKNPCFFAHFMLCTSYAVFTCSSSPCRRGCVCLSVCA